MAAVCRRFGVSRKTGYKWLDRYAQQGVAGLADQSKAPKRQAQAFPAEIEREILALRARYPTWGEDKLKARLERTNPDINWPAHSTIGALLKRHGLTHPGKRRRHATPSSKLTSAKAPNQVWAIDFKGWFETGDGKRCDPLTIPRDQWFSGNGKNEARTAWRRARNEEIRSIIASPSWRPYPERLPELEYPDRMLPRRVQSKGDIGLLGRQLFLSETLAGETVGLEEHEHGWAVWLGRWSWTGSSVAYSRARGRAGGAPTAAETLGGRLLRSPYGLAPRRPPSVSGKDFVAKNLLLVQPLNCYLCGWGKVLPRCWAVQSSRCAESHPNVGRRAPSGSVSPG